MDILTIILIIAGLCLFEIISSIDNAVINAQVLSTMQKKSRKWFLFYGLIFAVFIVRGLLPWAIIYVTNPSLGPIGALTASFSNNPSVLASVEASSPILLIAGGIFLLFLFLNWLFLEKKEFGLAGERFFMKQGVWFFAIIAVLLSVVVWFALSISPMLAFGAVIGSTAFFITHGFKQNAEQGEKDLMRKNVSDVSKVLYLEIIDATFSIDGVLGAFAFTLAVPLIIIGNGLGALVVRQLTVGNIEKIKKYVYLKNGAMYSIFFLGSFMTLDAFGYAIPAWLSPIVTFAIVGYFFMKSKEKKKIKQ